jgi:hypothetical protein
MAPVIAELPASGVTSLRGIAKALNNRATRRLGASASSGRYRSHECWRRLEV